MGRDTRKCGLILKIKILNLIKGVCEWKFFKKMNHGSKIRIQLALILRQLGLPKDLRQFLIKRVWFDCQSECLRLERVWTKENLFNCWWFGLPLKIEHNVQKCRSVIRIGTIISFDDETWIRCHFKTVDAVFLIAKKAIAFIVIH